MILEEIKMDEDNPDYLVHEIFTQNFWKDHPLGKPILGTKETVRSFERETLSTFTDRVFWAGTWFFPPPGTSEHDSFVEQVTRRFESLPAGESTFAAPHRRRLRGSTCGTRNRWSRFSCAWACLLLRGG